MIALDIFCGLLERRDLSQDPLPDVHSVVDLAKDPSALNHVDCLGVLKKDRAGFILWFSRAPGSLARSTTGCS